MSQVGEGCELVNGIVGYGCRIFYGVKAVRFFMASHSQLKYGARLINAYLGNNSTISCCEVLNTLIYPFHEQHHNNSFLCASLVMGQTNMAAGATIGSNHNSRSPDGELVAGRGFWPGLCVSLKHNSRFATFNILAKGDYPTELNIPLPFSLVSNDVSRDQLVIMPGYWFMYNLYALTRNEWKYNARDARTEKIQHLELNYLAPDTVNEMFNALDLFCLFTGKAFYRRSESGKAFTDNECRETGKRLLDNNDPVVDSLEILAEGFENSDRKVVLVKVNKCYHVFKRMIRLYGIEELMNFIAAQKNITEEELISLLPFTAKRDQWINVGGQLIASQVFSKFRQGIHNNKIKGWEDVHRFYTEQGETYPSQKFSHAFASLKELGVVSKKSISKEIIKSLFTEALQTRKWLFDGIVQSREKDYSNPFRKMVYENEAEMEKVVGSFEENSFIRMKKTELEDLKKTQLNILRKIKA